jgi:hypothetical protein
MTELQLGLLAIGALLVAGVLVYNGAQERGARRRLAREFQPRGDALIEGAARGGARAPAGGERRAAQGAAGEAEDLPDAKLDYLIDIDLGKPLPGKLLLDRMPSIQRRFASGVRVAVTDAQGVWRRLGAAATSSYARMRVGLQLVSRAGVTSEAELIEFRSEIENLAVELHATISAADLREAMESAQSLDRLCEDADIQIALHVNPAAGSGFDADVVAAEAAGAGMTAAGARHELRDGDGQLLFALEPAVPAGDARSGSLTLLLDVPRVADARRVYESMVRTARQLSTALGGSLADENGAPLDERSLAAIGAEIERIAAALGARGIATGGALARRLFA